MPSRRPRRCDAEGSAAVVAHENDGQHCHSGEIKGAVDLPRLKNSADPHVVQHRPIHHHLKLFPTRVIRHSLNPVWDEKLLFHVCWYEIGYEVRWPLVHSGETAIDVDQLLEDRHIEALEQIDPAAAAAALRAARDGLENECDCDDNAGMPSIEAEPYPEPPLAVILPLAKPRSPRKRKLTTHFDSDATPVAKRPRTVPAALSASASLSPPYPPHLRPHASSGPSPISTSHPQACSATAPPAAEETYPFCFCILPSLAGLVRMHDLPVACREVTPAVQVHFLFVHMSGLEQRQPAWMMHEA
ncbi:hypothetical protein B0H11DRAFT_2403627 [Mycena galericulata]|nr:hypothetical protein B0H11DRAFT_2403627 [Mycena galericulata]